MKSGQISLFVLTVSSSLAAQLTTGSIHKDNVVYAFNSFASSKTSSGGTNDFRVAGTSGQDHLVQSAWFWRKSTDTREYSFHNGSSTGPRSATYSADTALLSWSDLDYRKVDAELEVKVYSTGATAGAVVQKMKFTNYTGHPITISLFAYANMDQCGSTSHRATALNGGNKQQIEPPNGCTAAGEAFAPDADRFEVDTPANLRGKLTNSSTTDLANTGLPFGPGDYASAWQWKDRTLADGACLVAYLILTENHSHLGCLGKAEVRTYGTAKRGTVGLPVWGEGTLPFFGARADLVINNGAPGLHPICVIGAGRANIQIPRVGTLWVNPNPLLLMVVLNPFDANCNSYNVLTVPNKSDGDLCGALINFEAVFADPGANNGIAHTNGLEWVLGGVF